jgi:hypothetical protein
MIGAVLSGGAFDRSERRRGNDHCGGHRCAEEQREALGTFSTATLHAAETRPILSDLRVVSSSPFRRNEPADINSEFNLMNANLVAPSDDLRRIVNSKY